MQKFDDMGRKLMESAQGDKLKKIADSADGKKLAGMLDVKEVESAAKSGDAAALKEILAKVMNTDEGKRLAKKLSETMGGKK